MKLPLTIIVLLIAGFATTCAIAQVMPNEKEIQKKETLSTQTEQLTEEQAVEFAEKFIERNGYTDLQPDKEKLSYESIEWESDEDNMLKLRSGTLERKAFGVSRGRKGSSKGWTIVFKYAKSSDQENSKNGRAVTMNLDGSDARVEHVDFILAKVDKKL